jgi:pyrrolidone-carboxylate peptidase
MKRYLLLTLTTIPVFIAFGSGCKKEVPTVEAGATTAAVVDEAGAAPVADTADAAPAATLAVTNKPVTPVVAKDAGAPAAATPWAGTYTCFNGMSLSQAALEHAITVVFFFGLPASA